MYSDWRTTVILISLCGADYFILLIQLFRFLFFGGFIILRFVEGVLCFPVPVDLLDLVFFQDVSDIRSILMLFPAQAAPIRPQGDRRRGAKVLLRNRLDLRFCQRREICRFGGDNSLKRLRMMGLQIVTEEIDRAALARCMADEDDRLGMD